MSNEVENPSLRQESWELCKEYLAGPWNKVSLDEFRMLCVKGGFSNSLYRCDLPENINVDTARTPKTVLLRFYGDKDENTKINDVVTFLLLSEKKLGPKAYGIFPKGRLEEFIPSHSLSNAELRKYAPFIARELAKLHTTDFPLSKRPDNWSRNMNSWVMENQEFFDKQDGSFFLTASEHIKEIEWVTEEMKRTNNPIVFCHNDLSGRNMLYREDTVEIEDPKIMIIDLELGYYAHRSLDVAEVWLHMCFDFENEAGAFLVDIEKYPSKEEQVQFCAAYLDQLTKEGVKLKKTLKEELETMVEEMDIFACATNIRWALFIIHVSSKKVEVVNPTLKDLIQKLDEKSSKKKSAETVESASADEGSLDRMGTIMEKMLKDFWGLRMDFYWKFKERYLAARSKN